MTRGRRPGDSSEREQTILAAAKALFAERGFDGTTIRAIAEQAEVDPALVMHYFGSKQRLFTSAHAIDIDPSIFLDQLISIPLEERGRAMTELYVAVFADDGPGVAMLRSAASESAAGAMVREFIESVLLPYAGQIAGGPNSELRVSLAASHLIGTMFARHVIGLAPLVSIDSRELVDLLTPAVQRYLDGDR